jgi:hypothetical protein
MLDEQVGERRVVGSIAAIACGIECTVC